MSALDVWQRVVGGVFVLTGAFKLLHPKLPGFAAGIRGFVDLLSAIGIPLPWGAAIAVCALEVLGGMVLAIDRGPVRVACALLAIDMAVAFVTVGLPALRHVPVRVDGYAMGIEPWRVPVELVLLVSCAVFALWKR